VANAMVNAGNVTAQISSFSWLIVGNRRPAITLQPQDASVVEPATATFSVTAQGTPPLTLQWQRSDDGGQSFNDIPGATAASHTTGATSVANDHNDRYLVIVDSPEGATTSNAVTLTVTATPPTTARLTVTVTGNGTVASNPAGIACPGDCTEDYALNALVTITPTPASGFVFTSWSGDADCIDGSVFMNSARNCTATFASAPPPGAANARIAAGDGFSVARLANGQLRSWGTDAAGQLGDDPGDNSRNVPGPVDVLVDAQAIAAGAAHTVAVRGNGQVRGWGYNGFGQLGEGTNFTRTSPILMTDGAANLLVPPTSPLENAANVCAGALHTVVRLTTGRLVATGSNVDGQLGDGSNTDRLRPVLVDAGPGSFSADAIACGFDHTVALLGGRVYTWGGNGNGQLGDGTTTSRNRPVVLSGPTNVQTIAAGNGYSFAVDSNGALWAWGSNSNGKLGVDDTGLNPDRLSPVQVTGLSNVTAIVAGSEFSMALRGGVVYTWGINEVGTLGSGSTSPGARFTPAPVVGLPAGIVEIAASGPGTLLEHALAVDANGNVWTWGSNAEGQLGIGSANAIFTTPQQIPGGLNLN